MYLLHIRKIKNLVLLLSFMLLVLGYGCSSKSIPTAGIFELEDNTLIVKGLTARVTEDYMMIKYSRQDHIRLETSADMTLKGFPSLWAIESDQPVKINYRVENDRNIIIRITKMPRLGC